MRTYSQRDPSYGNRKLGISKLTVHGYGCFIASLATLYQRPVEELLAVQGAFPIAGDANLSSSVIARYCGGEALPRTDTPPQGWCIAVTDHYKTVGIQTHFFAYNAQTGQRVDPLDYPAKPEENTYNIVQYRPFTNIRFDPALLENPFPDVPNERWSAEAIRFCKEKGIMTGYPDGTFQPERPVTREELAVVIRRALSQ